MLLSCMLAIDVYDKEHIPNGHKVLSFHNLQTLCPHLRAEHTTYMNSM